MQKARRFKDNIHENIYSSDFKRCMEMSWLECGQFLPAVKLHQQHFNKTGKRQGIRYATETFVQKVLTSSMMVTGYQEALNSVPADRRWGWLIVGSLGSASCS
jgi:hypothetical protein